MKEKVEYVIISEHLGLGGVTRYYQYLADFFAEKRTRVVFYSYELHSSQRDPLSRNYTKKMPRFLLGSNLQKRLYLDLLFRYIFLFILFLKYPGSRLIVNTGNPFYFLGGGLLWKDRFTYIIHSYPLAVYSKFRLKKKLQYWFFQKLNGLNFKMISVSEFARNAILSKTTFFDQQTKRLYNPAMDKLDLNLKRDRNGVRIMTIGHLIDYKNPNFWLDVAKEVCTLYPEASFLWIGNGENIEAYRKKAHSIDPLRIQFIGEKEEVIDELNNTDIYFQPSLIESLGIAVIEAMSCEIPCVVSNTGGLVELVDDGESGLIFDTGKKESAILSIIKLIKDKDLRVKMGRKSRIKYESGFTIKKWSQNFDKILNEDTI